MSMQTMQTRSSHLVLSGADRFADSTADFLLLAARILLGWIFVRSGWGKVLDMGAFAATMPGRGLPTFLGYVAAPVEFFGGLALIFGLATRYAAALMLLFTIVATFSAHRYWEFADAAARRINDSAFYKNLSIMGGLIALFVSAGGRLSVDGALARKDG
jgi:putative oxidoreductase